MDYHRIYREFIADRKAREGDLEGYTERHHILPRSMGGTDGRENLVRLTAEDHFFAHLLLAKAHGGKMSAALYCMLQVAPGHWGRRMHSRGRYGLAKRMALPALSEAWSGDRNPLFNGTLFEWVNYRTGARETATLFAMHQKHGGSRGTWTAVANGYRQSMKGWLLASSLDGHKRSERGQVFHFVHRDGRELSGTQTEFCQHTGLNDASSWRVVHQASVTRCGWRLKGTHDRRHNCRKEDGSSGVRGASFTFRKGGETITGDRRRIATILGSTPQRVSASIYSIRSGAVNHYMGWEFVEQ